MTTRGWNRVIVTGLVAATIAWVYVLWHGGWLLAGAVADGWIAFIDAPWHIRAAIGVLLGVVGFLLVLSGVSVRSRFDSRADQHTDERRRNLRIVQKGRE